MDYAEFLKTKRVASAPAGFEPAGPISPRLKPFQSDIVRWALRRGRAAVFAGCGLGKTLMELEWAAHVADHTGRDGLILAPLAVTGQIAREADKFGYEVTVCRTPADQRPGVNVTNYERIHHFDPSDFGFIAADEASILKAYDGATKKQIIAFARSIPYRLAATATPAPNDLIELTNQAEFLDVMSTKEIVALFFTQDGNSSSKFRLKGHAVDAFWAWMASWAVAVRTPSDLGHSDDGYVLPPLDVRTIVVGSKPLDGYLIPTEAVGLAEQRKARRATIGDRVKECVDLVNASEGPFLVWCDLVAEADAIQKAIPDSRGVHGSDSLESKERTLSAFVDGSLRVMASKPSVAGLGLNLQHCNQMAFVGLSNSFEQVYQATRRCWRFGQTRPVTCWHVVSEAEGAVKANLERKERQYDEMFASLVSHMKGLSLGRSERDITPYVPSKPIAVPTWMEQSR